jgi:hypothetical protein
LNQRAIDGEVIVAHEALGLLVHRREKPLRHLALQQPVAVLRKHGVVPHRVVHAQADEPAKQQVVVDLLDQLALRTDRVKRLQQQRPQHVLGRDRRTARSLSTACRTPRPTTGERHQSEGESHATGDPPEHAAPTSNS